MGNFICSEEDLSRAVFVAWLLTVRLSVARSALNVAECTISFWRTSVELTTTTMLTALSAGSLWEFLNFVFDPRNGCITYFFSIIFQMRYANINNIQTYIQLGIKWLFVRFLPFTPCLTIGWKNILNNMTMDDILALVLSL